MAAPLSRVSLTGGRNLVATVTICRELATRPPARIGWQPQKYKSTKMHKLQICNITKVQKYKDLKLRKYNKCLEAASGNWPGGWEPQSAIRRCTVAPRHLARPENFTFKGILFKLKETSKVKPTLPIFSLVSCFYVSDSTDESSSAVKNSESTFCRCYTFPL